MTVKARLLALSLIGLFASGVFVLSAARASAETEDPFWKVAGKRLEAGTQKALLKNASGKETTLHSKIAGTEVELRCSTAAFAEGALEGSTAKHSGKASGILELSSCKLFAKEGEAFKEQTECEVPTIKSGKLAGSLWLEGTKAAAGTTAIVVFEAKEGSIAKVAINKETCKYHGTFSLEGSFAARLLPQNEEFTFIQWVLPETAIATAWRPPSEEGERSIGLKLEGNAATLQGELKVELETKEKFGGGTAPIAGIEAPFWGTGGKRLASGEEKELTTEAPSEPTKLISKFKGIEIEIRCKSISSKKIVMLGSEPQRDGGFDITTFEFTECVILIREGEKSVEQPGCEVMPVATKPLSGRLWLEGTREARGTKPLLVLEPKEMTEGKPVVAEETVRAKAGEKCSVEQEHYKIEGALPIKLSPASEESTKVGLSVVTGSTEKTVWQPGEQESQKEIKLTHGEEEVKVEMPKVPTKLPGEESFGGGSKGVAEGGGSGPYHATAKAGSGTAFTAKQKNTHVFTVNGSSVECLKATFKGTTPPAGGSQILKVLPVYEECKFAGSAAKVDNSTAMCEYEFQGPKGTLPKYEAEVSVGGSGCKIVVTATLFGFSCEVTVAPQTSLKQVSGEDLGVSHESGFLLKAALTNVTYTASGSGCGLAGIKSGKEGKYTGEVETEAIYVM